jgi:hypothetical protein
MGFYITHRYGADESNPPLSKLPALLDELDERLDDIEHTSVSLTHESEWCISAYRGGLLIFENVESQEDTGRHMDGVPTERIVALWTLLSAGQIEAVASEPWLQGYP